MRLYKVIFSVILFYIISMNGVKSTDPAIKPESETPFTCQFPFTDCADVDEICFASFNCGKCIHNKKKECICVGFRCLVKDI